MTEAKRIVALVTEAGLGQTARTCLRCLEAPLSSMPRRPFCSCGHRLPFPVSLPHPNHLPTFQFLLLLTVALCPELPPSLGPKPQCHQLCPWQDGTGHLRAQNHSPPGSGEDKPGRDFTGCVPSIHSTLLPWQLTLLLLARDRTKNLHFSLADGFAKEM